MLSIIVCSIDINYYNQLCYNIITTVGVEYEIIRIDNTKNTYSICEAYNKGASQAKYDLLCFIHEDIAFITPEWGKILSDLFKDKNIGLAGIAGTKHKAKTLSGWGPTNPAIRVKIRQSFKDPNRPPIKINENYQGIEACVCIDGVFMVTPKSVWEETKFDDHTFRKFHCYDLDYSFSVLKKGYKIILCYDILIEHFSEGHYSKEWYEETKKLHKKWKSDLPFSLKKLSYKERKNIEWLAKKEIVKILVDNNYPLSEILKNIFGQPSLFSISSFAGCILLLFNGRKKNKI